MRRAIVTGAATVSGVVLLLGMKPHSQTPSAGGGSFTISSSDAQSQPSSEGPAGSAAPSTGSVPQGAPSTGPTSQAAPSTGSTSHAAPSGTKTITGDAADTRYGPVQVAVTFNGKKITKIQVVEYPTESGRDREINSYAIPALNREAMSAQSANIDGVSGATYTTEGYQQSLQSAIDKANA